MNFDLQTVSVLIGVASAAVTLAFRLMPRSADRLKRDLELLKLAREAKASFLPLQRHVDAQIHEEYLSERLSFRRSFDIVFGNVAFAATISIGTLGAFGAAVAFGSKFLFSLADSTAGYILAGFVIVGVLMGLAGGSESASKELAEARKEIEDREKLLVSGDEETLRRFRASDSAQSERGSSSEVGDATQDESEPSTEVSPSAKLGADVDKAEVP